MITQAIQLSSGLGEPDAAAGRMPSRLRIDAIESRSAVYGNAALRGSPHAPIQEQRTRYDPRLTMMSRYTSRCSSSRRLPDPTVHVAGLPPGILGLIFYACSQIFRK